MKVILDNNLLWRMAKVLRELLPSSPVAHLSELGRSACDDEAIRQRLASEPVV
jgi:hypothetical protein